MFFIVYARIYAQALVSALAAIGRNLWTLVLPMGIVAAFFALAVLVAPLGMVGGFLLSFAMSGACSIYTYFVGEVVAKNRVGLKDLRTSIGAYFWTWVNIFFGLWIVSLLLGPMTITPEGRRLQGALMMLGLVAFNAAPEVIYQKGTSGFIGTVQASFVFLQENWIEWFIPNGLMLAAWWVVREGIVPLPSLPLPLVTWSVLAGALLHLAMVYRGFLFRSLDQSTHRQRMFRFRGKL